MEDLNFLEYVGAVSLYLLALYAIDKKFNFKYRILLAMRNKGSFKTIYIVIFAGIGLIAMKKGPWFSLFQMAIWFNIFLCWESHRYFQKQ